MYKYVENVQEKVHAIVYDKCNFNCAYCTTHLRDRDEYKEYSEDEFIFVSSQLLQLGKSFKFTGGEPTLNDNILRDTKIVKDLGGFIYLDTNGSRPIKIQELIERKLVDVLSVSLKGLSAENAIFTSNCRNKNLCWNNVLKSVELGNNHRLPTIVTYVFDSCSDIKTLCNYVDIFKSYDNVIFKFNNLFYENEHKCDLKKIQETDFYLLMKHLLNLRPNLKNRIIGCNNEESITDFSAHVYL